jgi:hypothetical protein
MAEGSFSFHDISQWVKKHPYGTGAIIFGTGALILYLYYDSGSQQAQQATVASSSGYGDYLAAETAAEAQGYQAQVSLQALQDSLAALQDSIGSAASVASSSDSVDTILGTLNAQTLQDSINTAGAVATVTGAQSLALGVASLQTQDFEIANQAGEQELGTYYNTLQNIDSNNNMFQYLNTATNEQVQAQEQQTADLSSVLSQLIAKGG